MWYADDCRDAILAGHDSAMRHRSAHFHHQATGGEEEGGPAGVGRGRDQDLSVFQMSILWIEDYSCGRGYDAWRGWHSPEHIMGEPGNIWLEVGFGAIGEQHDRHMTAGQFALEDGMPSTDKSTQIGPRESLVCFGERNEKDISGCLQPPGTYQFLSNWIEERPFLRQEQADAVPGHFAQASQSVGASEAEAYEEAAQPAFAFGTAGEFSHHRTSLLPGTLELHIRGESRITNCRVTCEDFEHIGWVLRPARYPQIEFGHAAMPIGRQEVRQAVLEQRGKAPILVVHCESDRWGMLDKASRRRVGLQLLCQCLERQVHLGSRIGWRSPQHYLKFALLRIIAEETPGQGVGLHSTKHHWRGDSQQVLRGVQE
jgi:hypothetical protein